MSKINQGQSYFNTHNARTATAREQNNSNSNSSDIVDINSEQSLPITYASQAVNPSLNQVKDLENQIEEEVNVINVLSRAIICKDRLNDSDFELVKTVFSKINISQKIKYLCSLVLNDDRQTCNRRKFDDIIYEFPAGYRQSQPARPIDNLVANSNNQAKTISNASKTSNESSNTRNNNNSARDIVSISSQPSTSVTYTNRLVNSNNQRSAVQIILEAGKISDELNNIKNNNFSDIDKTEIDARIDELGKSMSELAGLAKKNVNNPRALLVTAEELPLINGLIENSNINDEIRYYALWSIFNGVNHHKKQLEESSLNSIKNVLADRTAPGKLQKDCLLCLAKSAQNGQTLRDDVLDKVNEFINSHLSEQAILAKDRAGVSDKTVDELKKVAQNPDITGNSKTNKTLQNLVAEMISQHSQNSKNVNNPNTIENFLEINSIIENSSLDVEVRLDALWSILNGAMDHKQQLEKSSLDSIIKVLEDGATSDEMKNICLLCLGHAAKNGQVFETNVLNKIGNFIGSDDLTLSESAVFILRYTQDASKFSRQVITKIRNELIKYIDFDMSYRDQLDDIIKRHNQAQAQKYGHRNMGLNNPS